MSYKVAVPQCMPTTCSPAFDVSVHIQIGVWWCLIALIFISLRTYDVELLFISLFAIYSLVMCLWPIFFLMRLFVFLLVSFKSSFIVYINSPLSDVPFASISSQSFTHLLILLASFLMNQIF